MVGRITFITGLIKPFIMEIFIVYKQLTVEYNVKEQEQNIRCHLNLCGKPESNHQEVWP
jgi:hypothetical protein